MFVEELRHYLGHWISSRSWKLILLLGVALFGGPVFAMGLALWGFSIPVNKLAGRLVASIEERVDLSPEGATLEGLRKVDNSLHVPLNRILQLGHSNPNVVYIVASQLGARGRAATAARKMREIAPAGGKGDARAHAWLAQYESQRYEGTKDHFDRLLNDLRVADSGLVNMPVELTLIQVEMLVKSMQPKEALRVLEMRTDQSPSLNFKLAELAKALRENETLTTAIVESRKLLEVSLEENGKTAAYFIASIRMAGYENDLASAILLAREGVAAHPNSKLLARVYSNALLVKSRMLAIDEQRAAESSEPVSEDAGTELATSLEILDRAYEADPGNPVVMAAIAGAVVGGKSLNDELLGALDSSLSNGTASGEVYMLVGNYELTHGDSNRAIEYFERLVKGLPRSSPALAMALNNLAFAYTQQEPPRLNDAELCIQQAVQIPNIGDLARASIFDTQGDIRVAQVDWLGAIGSYERAVQLVNEKVLSREKLAKAYDNAGMEDLAAGQREWIEDFRRRGRK